MSDSQQGKRESLGTTTHNFVGAALAAKLPSEDVTEGAERFTAKDLANLRSDLLQSGLDSFQVAELVTNFLGGRGYGISADEARIVALEIGSVGCSPERMEAELSRVARVV